MLHIPLNIGHSFSHTASGLRREYCPRTSSKKNRGIPHSPRNVIYGIRKAPENNQYKNHQH